MVPDHFFIVLMYMNFGVIKCNRINLFVSLNAILLRIHFRYFCLNTINALLSFPLKNHIKLQPTFVTD